MQIVTFQNVSRVYINGDHTFKALDEMDFSLNRANSSSLALPVSEKCTA